MQISVTRSNSEPQTNPQRVPPSNPASRTLLRSTSTIPALSSHNPKLNLSLKSNNLRIPQDSNTNLKENLQTCSICYDEITGKQGYQMPDCDHIYHPICIGKWLTTPIKNMIENRNHLIKTEVGCPNCRTEVNFAVDKNLIAFNKILQRYERLAKAALMYTPFVEKLISGASCGTETLTTLTDQQLKLRLIPKKTWDSLPGLRNYLKFLETSKICLSQISYAAQELMENNLHYSDIGENNIASILHLLDSTKTLHSLLDNAQPYSIKNLGSKDMVVDDEQHMPVSLLDLSSLKKALVSTIQELDLSILFLLICRNNTNQEAL